MNTKEMKTAKANLREIPWLQEVVRKFNGKTEKNIKLRCALKELKGNIHLFKESSVRKDENKQKREEGKEEDKSRIVAWCGAFMLLALKCDNDKRDRDDKRDIDDEQDIDDRWNTDDRWNIGKIKRKLKSPEDDWWGSAYLIAQNWCRFGEEVDIKETEWDIKKLGGVIVFKKKTGGGHVGFLVGKDKNNYYVFGGNQFESKKDRKNRIGKVFIKPFPVKNSIFKDKCYYIWHEKFNDRMK